MRFYRCKSVPDRSESRRDFRRTADDAETLCEFRYEILNGVGRGVGGEGRSNLQIRNAICRISAGPAPSSPALLPRKAGGEGSQSLGQDDSCRKIPTCHNLPSGRGRCLSGVRPGFTLLEVVVGLALMASVLVASLLSFSAHRKQLRAADARMAAVAVADDLLEMLRARPDGFPKSSRGPIAGRPTWLWQTNVVGLVTPMQVPMEVIQLSIIDLASDRGGQPLVSVNLVEPVP